MKDYLVLSRGEWDTRLPKETVARAIADFYAWYEKNLAAGRMKPGHRLARERKLVSNGRVTDGPFTEAKEVIGGYWIIVAESLEAAAALAAENPCGACGLTYVIRPLELEGASVFNVTNETPAAWRG